MSGRQLSFRQTPLPSYYLPFNELDRAMNRLTLTLAQLCRCIARSLIMRFSCNSGRAIVVAGSFLCTAIATPATADDRSDFFENRIRPLLSQKCAECHTGKTPEGDLRIDSLEMLRKGGMGGPAIVDGDAAASLLIRRLTTSDPGFVMPPEDPLSESEIADVTRWINEGAYWPESEKEWTTAEDRAAHWAFQPVQDFSPPDVKNAA